MNIFATVSNSLAKFTTYCDLHCSTTIAATLIWYSITRSRELAHHHYHHDYNSNLAYNFQNTEQIKKHKFYNQCRSCTVSAKYGRA